MPPRLPRLAQRADSVCLRCRARLYSSNAPPPPPSNAASRLNARRLIAVHGPDSTHFLQGITTNSVRPGLRAGFYSGFLTAQGRVLNDVFIYPAEHSPSYRSWLEANLAKFDATSPSYLIEVDAAQASTLASYLKKYKLRAKIALKLLEQDELAVYSVWNESEPWTPHPPAANEGLTNESTTQAGLGEGVIGAYDARAPGMGKRLVLSPADTSSVEEALAGVDEVDESVYLIRRYLRGVAEGQDEIAYEHALPQESNMDYMGGIDFRKGCYVGQELTIRTHHTGVVRKRILPVQLSKPGSEVPQALSYDTMSTLAQEAAQDDKANIMPLNRKGRSAGKWIKGVGNIGLGLCRVEMMTDLVLTAEGSSWKPDDEWAVGNVAVKAFVPDWIRNQTKIKKENRRV